MNTKLKNFGRYTVGIVPLEDYRTVDYTGAQYRRYIDRLRGAQSVMFTFRNIGIVIFGIRKK